MLPLGLALLFVAFVLLISAVLTGPAGQEPEVVRRIAAHTNGSGPVVPPSGGLGGGRLTRSAVGLMSRVARTGRLDRALDTRLEAAGLSLRPGEWLLLHAGAAAGSATLFAVLTRGRPVAATLGLLGGLLVPWLVLVAARTRREARFLAQLPDTLQLLAGSLAVGHSLPQSLEAVVREARPPIRTEFTRALVETRLGRPAEDALEGIAARTGSQDFSWVVIAIRIQREVGGNLAELLTSVAGTLRERERLRRQVAALSAEGRLSGAILAALPVVFALYLMLARPDYIDPLFSTPRGIALLLLGVLLLAAGGFWMSRLIRVEV
ncbi:type II secretion system F family protein [Kineosporia sp. J2-2]|uniref:Type II secretion system F family protein n=1 Tax=Kineosporia corallincola TaxID=2835133 RepID=A0ABS5TIW0_9ACTN|nr:type II secretion system F family protein [Kineosporia corallincola]MBT0771034.1 type II secretion system F family protein [Kineosporia corallincola]